MAQSAVLLAEASRITKAAVLRERQQESPPCGYENGDPSKALLPGIGFQCLTDSARSLWGICPLSAMFVSDCGLTGACVDKHSCTGPGCGLTSSNGVPTMTCSADRWCQQNLMHDDVAAEVYTWITCAATGYTTYHYLATSTNDLQVPIPSSLWTSATPSPSLLQTWPTPTDNIEQPHTSNGANSQPVNPAPSSVLNSQNSSSPLVRGFTTKSNLYSSATSADSSSVVGPKSNVMSNSNLSFGNPTSILDSPSGPASSGALPAPKAPSSSISIKTVVGGTIGGLAAVIVLVALLFIRRRVVKQKEARILAAVVADAQSPDKGLGISMERTPANKETSRRNTREAISLYDGSTLPNESPPGRHSTDSGVLGREQHFIRAVQSFGF